VVDTSKQAHDGALWEFSTENVTDLWLFAGPMWGQVATGLLGDLVPWGWGAQERGECIHQECHWRNGGAANGTDFLHGHHQ
jgi:hypothetical protein